MRDLPYSERLAKINLETVELRRLKTDLIMHYKILHKLTPLTVEDYFTEDVHNRPTRSSSRILVVKSLTHNKSFDNDFFERQVSCYNDLPEQIKEATSLWTFKRQLAQTDLSKYLSIKSWTCRVSDVLFSFRHSFCLLGLELLVQLITKLAAYLSFSIWIVMYSSSVISFSYFIVYSLFFLFFLL